MSDEQSLQSQLQEKEELVAALTERLELAAEQLDRLQRTGAGRGPRGGAGLPPELIERQESLADELQQAVRQWQEMQAGLTLNNLETQVAELRALVASGLADGGRPIAERVAAPSGQHASRLADDADADTDGDGEDRWAALKTYLLDEDAEQDEPTVSSSSAATDDGDRGEAENNLQTQEVPAEPLDAVEPPAPLDAEASDPALLRNAVEARDDYIAFLIRKLRHAGTDSPLPADWSQWEAMPEELCRRVEELQEHLNEQLRLGEMELSLERARLGREESRIREMEENARRKLRQLGIDPELDGDVDFQAEQETGGGSRWLKMLGIGGDEEDDDDE